MEVVPRSHLDTAARYRTEEQSKAWRSSDAPTRLPSSMPGSGTAGGTTSALAPDAPCSWPKATGGSFLATSPSSAYRSGASYLRSVDSCSERRQPIRSPGHPVSSRSTRAHKGPIPRHEPRGLSCPPGSGTMARASPRRSLYRTDAAATRAAARHTCANTRAGPGSDGGSDPRFATSRHILDLQPRLGLANEAALEQTGPPRSKPKATGEPAHRPTQIWP